MSYFYFIGKIKFKIMGKLKFFAILFIGIILNSCIMDPEPEDTYSKYIIRNLSTHNIKLTIFDAYFDYEWKDTTFLLDTISEISYGYYSGTINYPFGGAEDSAYIVFDDLRQLTYIQGDGQVRNILDINSYSGGKTDDYSYQFYYEITDDDYENAIEIK